MNKEDISMKETVDTLLEAARSIESLERQEIDKCILQRIKKNKFAAQPVIVALGIERNKFDESNKSVMQWLIDILVKSGIYPSITPVMEKHNYTHITMVESWGENWFLWEHPLNCPHCDTDLRNHETGPPFKLERGVELGNIYDGVLYYRCPECDKFISIYGDKLTNEEMANPTMELLLRK